MAVTLAGDPTSTEIVAQFDRPRGETRVRGKVADDACLMFRLPREWSVAATADEIYRLVTSSGAEIGISARAAAELAKFPHATLAERDAAALQRTYEDVLGKPAQALAHRPTGHAGVTRWSATWIDGNMAGAGHSLSIETLIVETAAGAAVELTISGAESAEVYEAQVQWLLSSLRVVNGSDCLVRLMAVW